MRGVDLKADNQLEGWDVVDGLEVPEGSVARPVVRGKADVVVGEHSATGGLLPAPEGHYLSHTCRGGGEYVVGVVQTNIAQHTLKMRGDEAVVLDGPVLHALQALDKCVPSTRCAPVVDVVAGKVSETGGGGGGAHQDAKQAC